MAIFPILDEEARKRLALNPEAPLPRPAILGGVMSGAPPLTSSLPETPTPRPLPALERSLPSGPMAGPRPELVDLSGAGVPIPSLDGGSAPTPYSPMARDRYSWVTAGARDAEGNYTGKYRRSKGDIARGALVGFLQGLGSGGGLGAGLGGALAGGAVPLINPKAGREMLFDTTVAPRLMRDQAEAQRQQAMVRQAQQDAMDMQYKQAQIGALNRSNQPQLPGRPTPRHEVVVGPDGRPQYADLNDPANRGRVLRPYEKPRERTSRFEFDTDQLPYDLNNPEERQRFEALPRDKRVKPTTEKPTRPPGQALAALNELDQLQQDAVTAWQRWSQFTPTKDQSEDTPEAKERRRQMAESALRDYNQAVANFGAIYGDWFETGSGEGGWGYVKPREGARQTQRSQPPVRQGQKNQSGVTRPRSQFNSSKFPGLKFD